MHSGKILSYKRTLRLDLHDSESLPQQICVLDSYVHLINIYAHGEANQDEMYSEKCIQMKKNYFAKTYPFTSSSLFLSLYVCHLYKFIHYLHWPHGSS